MGSNNLNEKIYEIIRITEVIRHRDTWCRQEDKHNEDSTNSWNRFIKKLDQCKKDAINIKTRSRQKSCPNRIEFENILVKQQLSCDIYKFKDNTCKYKALIKKIIKNLNFSSLYYKIIIIKHIFKIIKFYFSQEHLKIIKITQTKN